MAWEDRDGRRYYYRKKRVGGRVVSEYVGKGEIAHIIARVEETDRQLHATLRASARVEREVERAQDRELAALEQKIAALTTATLLAAGYHQHKGQWRKRRS